MKRHDTEGGASDQKWRLYFHIHAAIVLWSVAVPILPEALVPAAISDLVRSFYFFTIDLTYPLAWLLPFVTLRLLILSRLQPNKFLLLSLLDGVLCIAHFLAVLPACI